MPRLTLSQFTTYIGNALRCRPELCDAWVTAELSDVRQSGGHCYMELVEKSAAGATMAKMRANIWANTYAGLRVKFREATGREISTGLKVLLRGAATHHPVYGFSFNVRDIDPSYTLGDIDRLRREILAQLQRLGIINGNKDRVMPMLPMRVAVISSAGAAGYGDFINQLQHNAAGYAMRPRLFEAVMQGERTAPSVIAAMDLIEESWKDWDCIVIIRGGGSTMDLNGFDNFELARRIVMSRLPVVVGIGHERDRTVLDEIACVRCKTPTAVAEYLLERVRETHQYTMQLVDMVIRYARERMQGEQLRLSNLGAVIPQSATRRLSEARLALNGVAARLPLLADRQLQRAGSALDSIYSLIDMHGRQRIADAGRVLEEIRVNMSRASVNALATASARLESLSRLVGVLDPENTLKRGYSITRCNGRAITDAAQAGDGMRIETTLYRGSIISRVERHARKAPESEQDKKY